MASLVARWYRINLQMQGTWVSSLEQEATVHGVATKQQYLILYIDFYINLDCHISYKISKVLFFIIMLILKD